MHYYLLLFFFFFLGTALSIYCYDFVTFAVYAAVFGFTVGAYVGLTSVILVDLLGLDKLTNAFGLLLLFQGLASLIGPPITGILQFDFFVFNVPYTCFCKWNPPALLLTYPIEAALYHTRLSIVLFFMLRKMCLLWKKKNNVKLYLCEHKQHIS